MGERVLLVDDDVNLLSALHRQMHKIFNITTASSGEEAVQVVRAAKAAGKPFAVVVADMRMTGLDGIETLAQICEIAPDTIRMMLTGNADQETAIKAINRGHIFRFFCKPSPTSDLVQGINDGIAQYRLATGEAELLQKIQLTSRALKTLSEANMALVHTKDIDTLLTDICRAAVDAGGYRMAWVGTAPDGPDQTIVPVASYGADVRTYLDESQLSCSDDAAASVGNFVGRAIGSKSTQILQNLWTDPNMASWQNAAQLYGFSSAISLPIMGTDLLFGALTIYSGGTQGFIPEEVELLEELASDMAFGIISQSVRQERDRSLEENQRFLGQLQVNLEETIKAFAFTVEIRATYTAGHQRRVAALAKDIALELELPSKQIEGLYLAALIHDLGKIKVPAEILSSPAHLTDIEYMLIKVHPQAAFEILKGINFPWPIARIVVQHHERLDGSGYPNGAKGDEILLEARILAVADIVESMSSHRPYRASLGIDQALREIEEGRGKHYDPRVVDAACRMFREKHYIIER